MLLRRTAIIALLAAGLTTACEAEPTDSMDPAVRPAEEPFTDPIVEAPAVEGPNIEAPAENEQALNQLEPPGEINVETDRPAVIGEPERLEQQAAQQAEPRDYVRLTVPGQFDETTKRLEKAVEEREGIEITKVFEMDEKAEEAGTQVGKTHVFAISSEELLSPLVKQKPEVALDLPLKVLVYERGGQVHIVREDVTQLASRHGLAASEPNIQKMDDAMDAIIASTVAQQRAEGVIQMDAEPEKAVLGEEEVRDY